MNPHDASCPMLYLVLGGELTTIDAGTFADPAAIHVIGVFASYGEAESRWRAAAQATVDAAQTRYFIVPIASLIDPSARA